MMTQTQGDQAQTLHDQAVTSRTAGDHSRARALMDQAIMAAEDADNVDDAARWRVELCQLYLDIPDYTQARMALTPAAEHLKSADLYLLLSRLLLQESMVREAIDCAATGLALKHDHLELAVHLGQIYVVMKQDEALNKLSGHAEKYLSSEGLAAFDNAIEQQRAKLTGP